MLKSDIIKFIYKNKILKLGTKKLKNGDYSDYFYEFGEINSGNNLKQLAICLNSHILDDHFNVIFTSAYKGIMLATALLLECDICYPTETIKLGFSRKEEKFHGETGFIVGHKPTKEDKVLLFDDVFTTGQSLLDMFNFVKSTGATVTSALVAINRGSPEQFDKVKKTMGVPIQYLVTDKEVLAAFDKLYQF